MKTDFTAIKKKILQLEKLYQYGPNKAEAIKIVGLCSRAEMDEILKQLNEHKRNIAADIEDILLFEDLRQLKRNEMGKIVNHFTPELIGLALRLAHEEVRKHFLDNMESDAREKVEAVLNGPPQQRSQVEAAITQIMIYVRELQQQGLLKITPGDHEHLFV